MMRERRLKHELNFSVDTGCQLRVLPQLTSPGYTSHVTSARFPQNP
jgi:hypothetical protein